jgi:putative flippase GtrA
LTKIVRHFAAFSGLGAIGTLPHFLVLSIAVSVIGVSAVAGSSAGAFAGALMNYLLNYHINYRSRKSHLSALPRFLLVASVGFVLNGLLMAWLTDLVFHLNYLLAQVVTTLVILVWNFSTNHLWTFGSQHS